MQVAMTIVALMLGAAQAPADVRQLFDSGRYQDVVKAGDTGDAYYVVGSGHLAVIENDEVVRDLGPGDYFGEVALLLDVPRTATVRTRTPARLFALDRAAFNKVIASAFRSGALRVTAADRMIQERT